MAITKLDILSQILGFQCNLGDTFYVDASGNIVKLNANTSATQKILSQTGTGVSGAAPSWVTLDSLAAVSGYSGISGWSGFSGKSGWSGFSGISGWSGFSGLSGWSGFSGLSGWSGYSGSGISGWSGFSGAGISGWSGFSGLSGWSGFSGISGWSGFSGLSGWSGFSGYSSLSGWSGYSGFSGSGISGWSGYSGFSGKSGWSGYSGPTGPTGGDGANGNNGASGYSGYSGINGQVGVDGASGKSGWSGFSGSGVSGWSGYSGSGLSGWSGFSGLMTSSSNAQCNSLGVNTSPSGSAGEIRATGNITAYYSDIRLKENVKPISNALAKVCSLTGVSYNANAVAAFMGYDPTTPEVGLIAQELMKVLPEAVAPAPINPNYLTIRYERVVALLVQAIKELNDKVKTLEGKV